MLAKTSSTWSNGAGVYSTCCFRYHYFKLGWIFVKTSVSFICSHCDTTYVMSALVNVPISMELFLMTNNFISTFRGFDVLRPPREQKRVVCC